MVLDAVALHLTWQKALRLSNACSCSIMTFTIDQEVTFVNLVDYVFFRVICWMLADTRPESVVDFQSMLAFFYELL